MAARTSLNVSITPELDQFVQSRVATGRYQTASEVIREGLRLLELQENSFTTLKTKLKRASAQADRGEFVRPESILKKIAIRKRHRSCKAK